MKLIKVDSKLIWLWVATIEPEGKEILGMSISKERNKIVADRFISKVIDKHGRHPVSTGEGTLYPQACHFFKIKTSYSFLI
ncbi:MAG TPA: hypothetical protein VIY08_03595 [Candidatus Nitrosocosmicus sp.]